MRLARPRLALGLLLAPSLAVADGLYVTAELPAALPVSAAQQGAYRTGAMPSVTVFDPLSALVAFGARLRAGVLRDGAAPADPALMDPGAAGLVSGAVALRVGAAGGWAELAAGFALTGRELAATVEGGVGYDFALGAARLGPSVRWVHVGPSLGGLGNLGSAELLLVGAQASFGGRRRVAPRRAEATVSWEDEAARLELARPATATASGSSASAPVVPEAPARPASAPSPLMALDDEDDEDDEAPDATAKDAKAEHAQAKGAKGEHAKAKDAKAKDAKAEHAQAEHAQAEHAQAKGAKGEHAKAKDAKSEHAQAEHAKAKDAKAEHAKADHAKADHAKAKDAKTEHAEAEHAEAEHEQGEPASAEGVEASAGEERRAGAERGKDRRGTRRRSKDPRGDAAAAAAVRDRAEGPAGALEVVDHRIVLPASVLFKTNRARVRSAGREALRGVVASWRAHPTWARMIVEGHADESGPERYNLELSRQRAERVRAVLIQAGLDPARIEAVGRGSSQPVARGRDEASRERNRRVELVIVEDGEGGAP